MNDIIQILDTDTYEKGKMIARSTQVNMLRQMVRMRQLDGALNKALQRGQLSAFLSQQGREAFHVGVAFGLKKGDWLFPGSTSLLHKGLPLHGEQSGIEVVQPASPGASRLVHANGTAWAAKLRGDKSVSCTTFGESIANQDNFHVALNFAGVHQTPALFICMVTGPYVDTAGGSVASRGITYGMPAIQVDGTDVIAMQKVTSEAARKARNGKGPTLIEAIWHNESANETPSERLARHLAEPLEEHAFSDEELQHAVTAALELWGAPDPLDCVYGDGAHALNGGE